MSGDYRNRNQLLLAVVESPAGTEGSPTPGSNAIKVRFPQPFQADLATLETDYVQDGLDQSDPIVGGGGASMTPSCYMKGAGTAGTAPETGVLYRGAGMSETLTAADVTGTAQAGAASTITLHAGASAVDNFYRGMVIETTGGTGSGQRRVILSYVGSTKIATVTPAWSVTPNATTTFAVRANALYKPVSVNNEALTLWKYNHRNNPAENSRRSRVKGAAGTFQITVPVRELVQLAFTFRGQLPGKPDDVARPSAPTYNAVDPTPFIGADAYIGEATLAGSVMKFNRISFDLGAQVEMFDDPAAVFGFDIGEQISRTPAGSITRNKMLQSSSDAFLDWMNSVSRPLWLNWGPAVGRRVSILLPAIRYIGNQEDDVRGFAADTLPFRATGADTGIFICVW